jgi:hypothetical protein
VTAAHRRGACSLRSRSKMEAGGRLASGDGDDGVRASWSWSWHACGCVVWAELELLGWSWPKFQTPIVRSPAWPNLHAGLELLDGSFGGKRHPQSYIEVSQAATRSLIIQILASQ